MPDVVIHVRFVDGVPQHLVLRWPAIGDHRAVEAGHARDLRGVLGRRLETLAIAVDIEEHAALFPAGFGLQRAPPVALGLQRERGAEARLAAERFVARLGATTVAPPVAAMTEPVALGRAAIGRPAVA